MKKLEKDQVREEVMNKLHRLGMIWLKIGQKSQGYTNTGTRRQNREEGDRERLGGKSEIKRAEGTSRI